ncbi:Para-nitrobenzyl esterase [Verticillium dahliae VDG2]|nr:Para-nitrobenzyl esterase [Verticillium dahliae VDG2]
MYVSQLLLAVAAASTAAAVNMAPREPTPTTAAAHVAGRDLAECSSVAADVLPQLTSAPTPDSDLARFILTEPAILSAEDHLTMPRRVHRDARLLASRRVVSPLLV